MPSTAVYNYYSKAKYNLSSSQGYCRHLRCHHIHHFKHPPNFHCHYNVFINIIFLINAKKTTPSSNVTPPSSGLSSSSFPCSNDKTIATSSLNLDYLSYECSILFSYSANKITASFETDSSI
jgi:hypothetical protein